MELAKIRELVGEAHHRQHQRVADGLDRGEMLRVAQDDLGDADPTRVADGFAQERIGALGAFPGQQVIRRLEIAFIDLFRIDEVEDVDRLRLLDGGGLEVVLGEDDELVLGVLVALDEVFPGDGLAFLLADALVAHRLFVLGVQQPELRTVIARRAVQLDGDVDEAERDRPFPH